MSEEKNGKRAEGLSETDKSYYEDLYNDLPKEVRDILMETHPLMGKSEDLEATAYRNRRPQRREDLEEVKEVRMQQVGSEIDEVSKAPQQEGDPTRYVSRRARNSEGAVHTSAPKGNTMNQEDYDDGIQYVSVLPARRKSKIVEEVTLQTAAPAKHGKKKKHKKEKEYYDEMGMEEVDYRTRYEDMDFEERAKQEHLDSLYDDAYYDDYGRGRGKLPIILGVVAVIAIIFFIFRTVSLSSQLEEAQNQLTQSQDYKQKYEDIQLEKMQLEEKLEAQNGGTSSDDSEKKTDTKTDKKDEKKTDSASNGGAKEYTVKEKDTMWTIAQSQLGNGADYQKILDANGLKEGDTLVPGTVIKIPQ